MSIVSYDLAVGEEPFLSYTWERREGPPLRRKGTSAPEMKVIDTAKTTSNAVALRFGSWRVCEQVPGLELSERQRDENEIRKAQSDVPFDSLDARVLQQMLAEAATLPSHARIFLEHYPDHEIVGMHGCGDLTMNSWNVAYVDGPLSGAQPQPTIVALSAEPFESRRYFCLVKWKRVAGGLPRMSIEEVQFSRPSEVAKPNHLVSIRAGDGWLPRANCMEFAVSNQQVIRSGKVVSAIESCHQFGDLRHLLQLPNLNPKAALLPDETEPYQSRSIFGREQTSDIWLGEEALLDQNNKIRAALSGPITIRVPNDCKPAHLRSALRYARYQEVLSPTAPLSAGQWRETDLREKEDERTIEIYFRRNKYAWSMLGLTKDNSRLLCLACDAIPGNTGYVLEDAARVFLDYGAWNALLIDEGKDVFQFVDHGVGRLNVILKLDRPRLRSVFIIGRRGKTAEVGQ